MTREELSEVGNDILLEFIHFYKNQFTYVGSHLGKRLVTSVEAEYRDELSAVETLRSLLQMEVEYMSYGGVEI